MPFVLLIIFAVFGWYSFFGSDSDGKYPATPALLFSTCNNSFPIALFIAPGRVSECDHSSKRRSFYHFTVRPPCIFSSNSAPTSSLPQFCIRFRLPECSTCSKALLHIAPSCSSDTWYLISFWTFRNQKFCFGSGSDRDRRWFFRRWCFFWRVRNRFIGRCHDVRQKTFCRKLRSKRGRFTCSFLWRQ